MSLTPRRRRVAVLRSVIALLALAGCQTGGACAGGTPVEYPDPPPPAGEMQPDVMFTRVDQRLMDFITSHISDVLRAQYPTREVAGGERAVIYLEEQEIDAVLFTAKLRDGCDGPEPWDACPSGKETYRSKLELNLDNIDAAMHARFEAGVGGAPDSVFVSFTDLDLFMDVAFSFGSAACRVYDDRIDRAAIHIEEFNFRVTMTVDEQSRFHGEIADVSMQMGMFDEASLLNIAVDTCDDANACLDPDCDGFTCTLMCVSASGVFNSVEFMTDLLAPLIEDSAPELVERMVGRGLDSLNGRSLASAQRVDLRDAAGDDPATQQVLRNATSMTFGTRPNSDTFRITEGALAPGMSVMMDGGSFADPSLCPPTVALPDFDALFTSLPVFDGTLEFANRTEEYHMAMAVSEAYVDQMMYALYQSGVFCLSLSTYDLEAMSGGVITLEALGLLAPSIIELGDPGAPVIFQIHPTQAPDISFGSGGTTTDGQGNTVRDPVIQLDLGELGISIYVFVEDQFLRVATVSADTKLGIAVARTAQNTLELGVDELRFDDMMQVYNELTPDTDFGSLLEMLMEVTLGGLLEGVASFDVDLGPMVSEALGGAPIYGRVNDVRRDGAELGYLSVYLTLCDEEDIANPARPPCYVAPAQPSPVRAPRHVGGGERRRTRAGLGVSPVLLAVEEGLDYQVRVDGTAWSSFQRPKDGVLTVYHPFFKLPGPHRVEVRVRDAQNYARRVELAGSVVDVFVD